MSGRPTGSPLSSRASTALLIFLSIPSLTSAASLHNSLWSRPRVATPSPEEIFSRASTCGDSSYVQCSGAGLPSDFCCPSGQSCVALAGNTTAICCPEGSSCAEIETIPCDVSLEDKSQHPAAVVMTSALTGTLETCGDQCCPFGYSCNGDGNCDMNSDQSAKPSTSSATASATVSTTATATSGSTTESASVGVSPTSGTDSSATATSTASSGSGSGSSTASAAADSTSTSGSSSDTSPEGSSSSGDSSSKAGVVAGGVIGGLAGAVLLGFLILFFVKRERRRKEAEKNGGDNGDGASTRSSSFGNILTSPVTKGPPGSGSGSGTTTMRGYPISKPILAEDMVRSDFGRMKSPQTPLDPVGPRGLRPGGVSEYYGGGGSSEKGTAHEEDDGFWTDDEDEHNVEVHNNDNDDNNVDVHEVARSPPRITTPRAVSSMYASYYDPIRASEYQAPLRMPSARPFGGDDSGQRYGASPPPPLPPVVPTRDPGAGGYINVFADSGSLAPPPLRAGGGLGAGAGEERLTRFSDVMNEAREGMGRRD